MNKDVQCQRRKDGNKGHSYILWLGDVTSGALLFDDGTRVEENYKWHRINGQIHHWSEPHEGTKYSIIIYKGSGKTRKADLIHTRRHAPAAQCEDWFLFLTYLLNVENYLTFNR